MSKKKEVAKNIAKILQSLAKFIEENPEIIENLELDMIDLPKDRLEKKIHENSLELDVFQIYADGGKNSLAAILKSLALKDLKIIIRKHGFDQSKKVQKWKNKQKVINLILDRVAARSEKGRVFEDYQN